MDDSVGTGSTESLSALSYSTSWVGLGAGKLQAVPTPTSLQNIRHKKRGWLLPAPFLSCFLVYALSEESRHYLSKLFSGVMVSQVNPAAVTLVTSVV